MIRRPTTAIATVVAAALLVMLPTLAAAQTPEQGKMHGGMQDESGDMCSGSDCPMMKSMQGDGDSGEPKSNGTHADHH